jgi:hypothetical protein
VKNRMIVAPCCATCHSYSYGTTPLSSLSPLYSTTDPWLRVIPAILCSILTSGYVHPALYDLATNALYYRARYDYYYIWATSMRRPLSYIQVPDAICVVHQHMEWVLERTSFVFSQAKWHPSLTLTVSSCRHRPFLCYTIYIHYITINHYMSSAFRVLQPLLQPYYYAYHFSFFTTTYL